MVLHPVIKFSDSTRVWNTYEAINEGQNFKPATIYRSPEGNHYFCIRRSKDFYHFVEISNVSYDAHTFNIDSIEVTKLYERYSPSYSIIEKIEYLRSLRKITLKNPEYYTNEYSKFLNENIKTILRNLDSLELTELIIRLELSFNGGSTFKDDTWIFRGICKSKKLPSNTRTRGEYRTKNISFLEGELKTQAKKFIDSVK